MRVLLDTHAVLWLMLAPARVPPALRAQLTDPDSDVATSAACAWEIAVKQSNGKLALPGPAEQWLPAALERAGLRCIDVTLADVLRVRALPWHHKDPFDRLLVAQAMGGWVLATHDPVLARYGVPVIWG